MKTTRTFDKALAAIVSGKRVVALQSGMRTGKTYSLTQIALLIAMHKKNYIIMVVCPTFRHLKTGAFRDIQNIIKQEGLSNEVDINLSSYTIQFKKTDSKIEYVAVMESGEESIRGRSCDICWFNECNVSSTYEIYQAIAGRCREQIWADYNPSGCKNWWLESKVLVDTDNAVKVKMTIDDNPYLTQSQVDSIMRMAKHDPTFDAVYLRGEYADISELQIITNYQIVPHADFMYVWSKGTNHAYGVDFGFVTSYTTVVEGCMVGGELYVRERIYERALLNHELADKMIAAQLTNPRNGVADSAEQKTIADINQYGKGKLYMVPAVKGKDSVLYGLQALKAVKINVDSDSHHIINDLQNYEWTRDKSTGDILQIANKQAYDAHTVDAIRYMYASKFNNQSTFQSFAL